MYFSSEMALQAQLVNMSTGEGRPSPLVNALIRWKCAMTTRLHELSLAQNIVDTVLSEAEKRDAKRVKEISVDIGQLMQLDRKALTFALRLLMVGPQLKGTRVRVHTVKATFSCQKCKLEWGMAEAQKQLEMVPDVLKIREPDSKELPLHFLPYLYPAFIHCPRCGSSDIISKEGTEIQLSKVIME